MNEDQKNKLRSLAKQIKYPVVTSPNRESEMYLKMEKRQAELQSLGLSKESIEVLRVAAIKLGECTTGSAWNWFFFLTGKVIVEIKLGGV